MKRFYKIVWSFLLILVIGIVSAYYVVNKTLVSENQTETVTSQQVEICAIFKDLID